MNSEGSVEFYTGIGDLNRKLDGFYNPIMKLNRDLTIAIINSMDTPKVIALPLAASGVRGLRILKECLEVEKVDFNDHNPKAVELIKKNLSYNNLEANVYCKDANQFLLDSKGYTYIDLDPFGSPNFLLNSAAERISRNGVIAVTATDTAALCGTYPKTCLRKYWALPSRDYRKHEFGLRILIRKVQLIFAQFEKALTPILSYSKDHYMRIFFKVEKGKIKADKIIQKHDLVDSFGPMWIGDLNKKSALVGIKGIEFLENLKEEIYVVGFFDVHAICKKEKLNIPKTIEIRRKLNDLNVKNSITHFSKYGIKADCSYEKFVKVLSDCSSDI
jgi:tRNA (guanine26-N2/guanine27-N2)-dimethyltransferase